MDMKKILGSLLALGLLAGCGNEKVSETPKEEENVAAVENQETTEEAAINEEAKTSKMKPVSTMVNLILQTIQGTSSY